MFAHLVLPVGKISLSETSPLIPVLAWLSPGVVVVVRMLQDPASGLSFPNLYNLFSTFDSGERPTITYPGGKCMAFYVSSTTGMVWYGLFCDLIYSM